MVFLPNTLYLQWISCNGRWMEWYSFLIPCTYDEYHVMAGEKRENPAKYHVLRVDIPQAHRAIHQPLHDIHSKHMLLHRNIMLFTSHYMIFNWRPGHSKRISSYSRVIWWCWPYVLAIPQEYHAIHSPLDDIHRSEEHTSELQSRPHHLVCRLLLEKKKILLHLTFYPVDETL